MGNWVQCTCFSMNSMKILYTNECHYNAMFKYFSNLRCQHRIQSTQHTQSIRSQVHTSIIIRNEWRWKNHEHKKAKKKKRINTNISCVLGEYECQIKDNFVFRSIIVKNCSLFLHSKHSSHRTEIRYTALKYFVSAILKLISWKMVPRLGKPTKHIRNDIERHPYFIGIVPL